MKAIGILCIFGSLRFSTSVAVIFHPSSKYQNEDSRIYFQDPMVPYYTSQLVQSHLVNFRNSIFHTTPYNVPEHDDRIYFPEGIHAPKQVTSYIRLPSPTLQENQVPPTRFRHSLAGEEKVVQTKTEISVDESFDESTETSDDENSGSKLVPLSFLEEWAKKNAMQRIAMTDSKESDSETTTSANSAPIVNLENLTNQDEPQVENFELNKSISFQSLFQLPKLTGGGRRSIGYGNCPPNHGRNHYGKCVKLIRIIIFEDDELKEDTK